VPELPDIELYLHALEPRVVGEVLARLRLKSPFLLRTVDPKPGALEGRKVTGLRRIGKRIVFAFEGDHFAVLHLMIAGRLQWKAASAAIPKRNGLAAFDFPAGSLILTEASKKKRARLHLVRGEASLEEHDPGGLEPLAIEREREHHFIAPEVEVEQLIAYLGPRLVTGAVDRVGTGATFRGAVPREVDQGAVRLDVSAHPSRRGGSRLTIIELPAARVDLEPGELDPARVRTAQQALRNLE